MPTPLSILIGHYLFASQKLEMPAFAGFDADEDVTGPETTRAEIDSAREKALRYLATVAERMIVADGYPIDVTLRFLGIRFEPAFEGSIESVLSESDQVQRIDGLYSIFDISGVGDAPTGDCVWAILKNIPRPWPPEEVDRALEECSGKP